jgi:hypothetical protein
MIEIEIIILNLNLNSFLNQSIYKSKKINKNKNP